MMSETPKFKAGQLVRLRDCAEARNRPDIAPLLGQVWMLREGNAYVSEHEPQRGWGWRWHIPEVPRPFGALFAPFESVLERVDQPPEKGNWDDCAWNPYTSTDKE